MSAKGQTVEISARSYLTAGISLTAATAVAFAPLAVPQHHPAVALPKVSSADVRLTVTAADIEALVANVDTVLGTATSAINGVVGIPGQTLIGLVNNNILTLIDDAFTGLIDATDNPTLVASLTILKTLTYDAYVMLGVNLGRINPVITATTEQVGELLTSAVTGSLRNVLTAVAGVANDPLSPATYVGLLDAGLASGQLIAGNGLEAAQTVGDGGFEIVGIARDEVTFQFNNAVSGLSALATQLGEASDNAVVEAVIGAVRGFAVAPAAAVVNLGSSTVGAVLDTTNAGFDAVLDTAQGIVNPPATVAAVSVQAKQEPAPTAPKNPAPSAFHSDAVVQGDAEVQGDAVVTDEVAKDDAADATTTDRGPVTKRVARHARPDVSSRPTQRAHPLRDAVRTTIQRLTGRGDSDKAAPKAVSDSPAQGDNEAKKSADGTE